MRPNIYTSQTKEGKIEKTKKKSSGTYISFRDVYVYISTALLGSYSSSLRPCGRADARAGSCHRQAGLRPSVSIGWFLVRQKSPAQLGGLLEVTAASRQNWERLIMVVGSSGGQSMQLLTTSANAKRCMYTAFIDTTTHGALLGPVLCFQGSIHRRDPSARMMSVD